MTKLADTKAAGEVKALETFYTMLQTEPEKAFYGLKQVEKANESQAVEVLMISDSLFRFANVHAIFCIVGSWTLTQDI